MHKTFRLEKNDAYWDRRWSAYEKDADNFENKEIYPIKYAEMAIKKGDKIAELGCGLGRVFKYYHRLGYDIIATDNSKPAIEKLQKEFGAKVVLVGVEAMPFKDGQFDVILAFGVFHNIEKKMEDAIKETLRCMKRGGKFCISMQPNNMEMRMYNLCHHVGLKMQNKKGHFHKWLVGKDEFKAILERLGCDVENIFHARNVPALWRIPFLRLNKMEIESRSSGYELNRVGKRIDNILTKLFPESFSNVLIYMGRKK